jgi:multimeric flavodoxin WrbA
MKGRTVKIIAFSGSARRDGNTAALIRHVFAPLEAAGHECELVQLAGKKIHGCTACNKCRGEGGNGNCQGVRDFISEECIPKALAADAIIIGSPVYFADVTTETKALMDRMGYAGMGRYTRKVGAGLVAVRRAGAMHALDTIQHVFQYSGMVTIGSTYWNIGIGREPGAVEDDAEGIRTMENLGANMVWLLEKLHA